MEPNSFLEEDEDLGRKLGILVAGQASNST
jgi:hypothetical protein